MPDIAATNMADEASPAAPGTTNQQLAALHAWEAANTQRLLALNAPPARAFADIASNMFGRGNVGELMKSSNVMDKALGEALSMGGAALAEKMGLSPVATIQALQNTFSAGNLRVATSAGFVPMAGYTALADQATNLQFEDIQKRFTHAGGALNLKTTYGASRDDIGSTLNELNRRGAFAGESMGTVEAGPDGSLSLAPNQQTVSKMTSSLQEALKNLQALRSALGNIPVPELMAEMERLTGLDIARPGNMARATSMMQQSIAQGATVNMSASESLQFRGATASTFDAFMSGRFGMPMGSFAAPAAGMAGSIDAIALAAHNDQTTLGGGYRSRAETATAVASNLSSVFAEAPELLEAAYAASQMQGHDAERSNLLAAVRGYSNNGSLEARQAARRNLSQVYKSNYYGTASGSLINELGPEEMLRSIAHNDPSMLGELAAAGMSVNQNAMIGDFTRISRAHNASSPFHLNGNSGAFAFELFNQFGAGEQMNQIQAAIAAGDMPALQQVTKGATLGRFGEASSAIMAASQNISAASGGAYNAGDYLHFYQSAVHASTSLADLVGSGAKDSMQNAMASASLVNLAGKGMTPLSLMQQAEQGFLGGEVPLEDRALISYGLKDQANKMLQLRFNKDTMGLEASEGDAEQLAGTLAGSGINLYEVLGVDTGDKKALKEKLATAEGAATVGRILGSDEDQIAGISVDGDESSLVVSADPKGLRAAQDKELEKIRKDAGLPAQGGKSGDLKAEFMKAISGIKLLINMTLPGTPNTISTEASVSPQE